MYGIRSHVQLTHDHHNLLHSVLKTDPYPTKEVKQALSDQIGVSYKQIDQWFRNRRRKSYIKQCMEKSLLCESVEKSFPAQDPLNESMLNMFGIRTKVPLTKEQLKMLHSSFMENSYPSKETKQLLSASLALPVSKISQWFKDQRKKYHSSGAE